jgi:hypothetical protein
MKNWILLVIMVLTVGRAEIIKGDEKVKMNPETSLPSESWAGRGMGKR